MIPKASQRAGGQQLATHLLNRFDNDRVELFDLRGAIAPDLHGAFAEWRAVSRATHCRKYLYSLSLNPDPQQGALKRDLYLEFIARAEKSLGLEDQPRAVVFHVKHGREHCHVVWSRIDTVKLKAVQLSHDRQKLRTVAREFARDHGLHLPPGMQRDRGTDRFKDRKIRENLAEQQQEERTGITKQQRMLEITQIWRETKDGVSFVRALEQRGYYLARGDRRTYVVVDHRGEIHSLARQIMDAKTADVKARLKDYPVDRLADAKKAQDFARTRREQQASARPAADPALTPQARREALAAVHKRGRDELKVRRDALQRQHDAETAALKEVHDAANKGAGARLGQKQTGILAFLSRITGVSLLIEKHHRRQDRKRAASQENQREALSRRHRREMQDFRHFEAALESVEKRERRSLETTIRREAFLEASRGSAGGTQRGSQEVSVSLTPSQRLKLEEFRRAGQEKTKPRDDTHRSDLWRTFREAGTEAKARKGEHATDTTKKTEKPAQQGEKTATQKGKDPLLDADALLESFRKAEEQHKKHEGERSKTNDKGRDYER